MFLLRALEHERSPMVGGALPSRRLASERERNTTSRAPEVLR